ncbi:MAG TPA: hypothetical protein DCY25_13090 [Bacteroidales bacterium]|nr:hypothetical protein [Bacteroidales bacterium]
MISSLSRDELYYRQQLSHDQIDDILAEKRAAEFPESKARHLGKLNAFLEVSSLLENEGISFIPQKGPVLSYRLYGDPLYRTYNDLDFLIDADQIPGAVRLLIDNDFEFFSYTFPEKKCYRELLFRHVNELCLWSPSLDAGIELHWRLVNGRLSGHIKDEQLIRENSMALVFHGREFKILNNDLELLYLVIHGALHGWKRLKWLLDVKVFLQKFESDELRFAELVRQFSAGRPVAVCNELLKIFFPGTKLLPSTYKAPAGMVRFALQQINQPDGEKGMAEFLGFLRNSWRAFPGMGYKIDLLKRNLFATDLANASWMPCSALAYYIVSPFQKLIRGFRG